MKNFPKHAITKGNQLSRTFFKYLAKHSRNLQLSYQKIKKKTPDFFVIRELKIDWSRTRLYNTFHYKTQLQNTFFIVIVVFIITRLHRRKKSKHIFIILTLHTTPLKKVFFLLSSRLKFSLEFVISENWEEWVSSGC